MASIKESIIPIYYLTNLISDCEDGLRHGEPESSRLRQVLLQREPVGGYQDQEGPGKTCLYFNEQFFSQTEAWSLQHIAFFTVECIQLQIMSQL